MADAATLARNLPDVELVGEDQRRDAILELRALVEERLPHLIWIHEGRTPWEVFWKKRIIGNSRIDPCSEILKRNLMEKWREENCNPGNTILHFGIDWTEEHRLLAARIRMGFRWDLRAPLCKPPFKLKSELIGEAKAAGIEPPRLYAMGFAHNNCGGFCVKAGQKSFEILLKNLPARYAYHERKEAELSARLLADGIEDKERGAYTILRRQKKGKKEFVTLKQFREEIEGGAKIDDGDLAQGCGCALE